MAHLFPSSLFVYKAREAFISNLSLIKLENRQDGLYGNKQSAHINFTVWEDELYINSERLMLGRLVKMEIARVPK